MAFELHPDQMNWSYEQGLLRDAVALNDAGEPTWSWIPTLASDPSGIQPYSYSTRLENSADVFASTSCREPLLAVAVHGVPLVHDGCALRG